MSNQKLQQSNFDKLMSRLKVCSELKYPERIWSAEVYISIAFEWLGKEDLLEERVLKLEKELGL